MTIRPVRDQIVAIPLRPRTTQREDGTTITDGGVIVPESVEEKEGMVPMVAKVKAVGPGKMSPDGTWVTAVSCKEGDTIVYRAPYGNHSKFNLAGVQLLLLEEKDILAVLEESRIVEAA